MANNKPKTREEIIRQDMQDLHKLGYAQQLFREMGGFSNFAISFSIISILTGAILLYGYGLGFAGPIINTYGWPLVSLFVLAIAASMAELASAYPTAGGLYFWAHRLGGHRWAWVTAWFNMLGQIMITAGIDFAAAIYIAGAFNRIVGTNFDTTNTMTMVIVMIIIMIPQMLINIFGIRLTARLSDFSVWWHIGGVAIMVLLLLIFGKFKNEFGFLFQSQVTVNPNDLAYEFAAGPFTFNSIMMNIPGVAGLYAGGGLMLAFTLGLLQAQWTYTGYDASAHVAEETVMARLNSAWGVFLSVAVSSIVGYIMLLTLTLHIPNGLAGIADVVAGENSPAVLYIVYQNFDTRIFSDIIAIIIGVAMWLCGLSSITSMSRMWYAFARDNGMPGSSLIKQIPHAAHAGLGDRHHLHVGGAAHRLFCGILRDRGGQHDGALSGVRDSDLPEPAQQTGQEGRIHHAQDRAVEPARLWPRHQRDRPALDHLYYDPVLDPTQRAGGLVDHHPGDLHVYLLAT